MPAELLRPARASYCLGVISQALTLVLQAAVSLRGAAAIFLHLPRLSYDPQGDWPTAGTIQMWLLRLGLDELQAPLEQADDWAWLADHTIQIGKTKCLLIVAVRLSRWRELGGQLTHHDLSVVALEPVELSNGDVVRQQLEAAASRTGLPRMISSDHGSDLKKGIDMFQQQHPEVSSTYDIAHKMALLLKKILEGDERWAEFTKQCGQTRSQLQQTSLAHFNPPPTKPKARYMNADEQIGWGLRVLQRLDRRASPVSDLSETPNEVRVQEAGETCNQIPVSLTTESFTTVLTEARSITSSDSSNVTDTSQEINPGGVNPNDTPSDVASEKQSDRQLQDKLGWVRTFADALVSWSILMTIAAISRNFVRHHGYHAKAAQELRQELAPHAGDVMGDQLIDQVCAFVAEQSALVPPGEQHLGSTEILESLIGKGKRLEGQQSKSGFTKMVLSLAAATVAPTVDRIKTALDRTLTKHVHSWAQKHIPRSLQAQRRADLPPLPAGTNSG